MKTLTKFRSKRRLISPHEFKEIFGTSLEDMGYEGINEILLYGQYHILSSNEYTVDFNQESHSSHNLERLEEILWDDYVKHDQGISFEKLEEELHQRARKLLSMTEYPTWSLDEAIYEGLTNPFHRQQAHYLMERFDRLSEIKPEIKVIPTNQEKLDFAKHMAQLLFEQYIESYSIKEIQFENDEFMEPINIEFVEKVLDDQIYMEVIKSILFYEILSDLKESETLKFYTNEKGKLSYRPNLTDYYSSIDTYIIETYSRELRLGKE